MATQADVKSRFATVFQDPSLPADSKEEMRQAKLDFTAAFGNQPIIDRIDEILDGWVADPSTVTPESVGELKRLLFPLYNDLPPS